MDGNMITVQFSFLASGPTYQVPLPGDFDPLPNMSTPIFNGKGGRSVDFIPSSRDRGLTLEEDELVDTLRTRDGHTLEVWFQLEPPPVWWLRWPVQNGALYTHLREWDGVEMAEVTANCVSIIEGDATRPPFLVLDPPFKYAASANPGYSESGVYLSSQRGDGWSLALQRPGFVPKGTIMQAPSSSVPYTALRAGAAQGLEVKATSPLGVLETRELLTPVLEAIENA